MLSCSAKAQKLLLSSFVSCLLKCNNMNKHYDHFVEYYTTGKIKPHFLQGKKPILAIFYVSFKSRMILSYCLSLILFCKSHRLKFKILKLFQIMQCKHLHLTASLVSIQCKANTNILSQAKSKYLKGVSDGNCGSSMRFS